jgi:archaeal flagellar protein FlaJ
MPKRVTEPLVVLAGLALLIFGLALRNGVFPSLTSGVYGNLFGVSVISVGVGIVTVGIVDLVTFLASGKFRPESHGVMEKFSPPSSIARPLLSSMSGEVSSKMSAAGLVVNPLLYVTPYVTFAIVSLVITVPVSLFLFLMFRFPLFLAINVLPVLILIAPTVTVSDRLGKTTAGVESELPYLALFAAVLQSSGVSLYHTLVKMRETGKFAWIALEAALIEKENVFFGKTEAQAIQERARIHPSQKFKQYLQGYASTITSGGDVSRYLEDKVSVFLGWSEFNWKKYANDSSDIGEAVISIFFVLPMIILTMSFIYPNATLNIVELMVFLILPMLSGAAYFLIDKSQPKSHNTITVNLRLAVVLSVVAGVFTALLFPMLYWLVVATSVGVFAFFVGRSSFTQLHDIKKIEEDLPQFLRDLTEYKKIGYDITKAIQKLGQEGNYSKQFTTLLQDVSKQLSLGLRMKEVIIKTRSWLTGMMFDLTAEIVESGGGTPELLELVTDFTQRIETVKKETRSNMRLYEILSVATPVGLTVMIVLIQFMLQQFGGIVSSGAHTGFLNEFSSPSSQFLDLTKLLIIEASVATAFLASKAIDFTNYSTYRVFMVVVLVVAAFGLVQVVTPIF